MVRHSPFAKTLVKSLLMLGLALACIYARSAHAKPNDVPKVPDQCSRLIKRSETLISSGCSQCCGPIKEALAVVLPEECMDFVFRELPPGIQKRLTNQAAFKTAQTLPEVHGALLAILKKKAAQNKCELEPLAKNTTVNALASPGSSPLPEHSSETTLTPSKATYVYSLDSSFGSETGQARSVPIELGHQSVITTPKNKYAVLPEWVTTSVYPTGILRTKITPMPGFNELKELTPSYTYGPNCSFQYRPKKKNPEQNIDITCKAVKQGPVEDVMVPGPLASPDGSPSATP